MLSRRSMIIGAGAIGAGAFARTAGAEAIRTDDGLYRQPWFLDSFLELGPDLDEAAGKGKRLAVMWELRGCPACRQTHLVNFADPEIERFVKDRFEILHLNILGLREVTDFDGERLPEKRYAAKYGVRATPTFQFFPERSEGLAPKPPLQREVARAQGYLEPKAFRRLFAYVADKAYKREPLEAYLRAEG